MVVIMKKNGYTIPELMIVIVVMGLIAIVVINKASFAFTDPNETSSQTDEMILKKSDLAYGRKQIESLKMEDQYISGKDLIDNDYLIDSENKFSNVKIKLSYNAVEDNISVEILE